MLLGFLISTFGVVFSQAVRQISHVGSNFYTRANSSFLQHSWNVSNPKKQSIAVAHISVVIPVYKAEGCLHELYRRLMTLLVPEDYFAAEVCYGINIPTRQEAQN